MVARLLAILGMVGCALASAAMAQDSSVLKVVTYNIRYANSDDGPDAWDNRVDAVASVLNHQDLAGLQEVTATQLDDLRTRLGDFDWYGVGRDDGQRGGEHAVIFYRRDRFEPVDRGTFWLSERPDQVGVAGWDAALPRTCTWMILRENLTGTSVLVADTHFDHRGAVARKESGSLIRHRLQEIAGELPIILLGDFNCKSDSEPYRAMMEGGYLLDARDVSKSEPTGADSSWNGFEKIQAGHIIDHIFVHGPLEVAAIETLDPKTSAGRFASDHLPVRALIMVHRLVPH